MEKVLLSLSGGIDSTTVLSMLLSVGYEVQPVWFYYSSKHNKWEEQAVTKIVDHYGLRLLKIDLSNAMTAFNSSLLMSGDDIPFGHYESESMRQTVVPGRNLIFLSIMAGLAESLQIENLAIGVHQGDHFIYPDCRPEFITSAEMTIQLASDFKVKKLLTPILSKNKAEVVGIAHSLGVPLELTRTCYTADEVACGKCGSCTERLEAFELNGLKDPIRYAE